MSTAAVAAPKVSWLKKVGQTIGKILGVIAKDAAPVADTAAKVAEALLPQFAPEIQAADNLVTNIAKEAIAVEGTAAAAGTATNGAQKLEAVVASSGPAIDAWVAASFPGAKTASAASKAGLVSAVVKIMNDLDGGEVAAVPTA